MSLSTYAQGIHSGNCIIHDSCGVVYSHKQDERCIIAFMKVEKQLQMISLLEKNLQHCDTLISDIKNQNEVLTTKLRKTRLNVIKSGLIGLISGFVVGVLIQIG